jgi:NAD(P)-dependent dehydrogenase (short-subunit alcohol dehydrogenase family)
MELPESEWRRIFDANCTALFLLASELAPAMKRAGRGRIVAIGATSALMRSHSIYGLGKAGLIHLVEALAIELAPEITVNAVSPGLIADNEDMTAEFSDDAIADTPLRRLVTRGEIANVVAAICGPPFDVVTGQNIVMDGGRVLPRRG